MTNIIFWNVDTQYDFMRDDERYKGKLAVPGAKDIEPNLERLTAAARQHGIKVINTADWHTFASKEFSQTPDYAKTFPPHCIMHTPGAKYVPATEPLNPYVVDWRAKEIDEREIHGRRNIVIYKDAFDAFEGNPHTSDIVQKLKPDHAVVYGVATNYCVQYAVQGLLKRGIAVTVASDAIKEIPNCDISSFIDTEWRTKGVHLDTTAGIERMLAHR